MITKSLSSLADSPPLIPCTTSYSSVFRPFVNTNFHFGRSFFLLPCVKLCLKLIGLNLKYNSRSNGGLVFYSFKSSKRSNHALKACYLSWYLFMDKSLCTIYMRRLIIHPTAIVDYSLFTSKPLYKFTISKLYKIENCIYCFNILFTYLHINVI